MDDQPQIEFERLANEHDELRRRYMKAIFDDNTAEVRRTRAQIRDLGAHDKSLARLSSGFDVVG
jgi:hypothetical protein